MQHACLLLEHIGGSSGGELLSGQEREQREKAVAVEASEQEDRLCDLDRYCRYIYPPILSINKDTGEGSLLCCVSLGRGITGGSRYYIGGSAGNRPRTSNTSEVQAPAIGRNSFRPNNYRSSIATRFDASSSSSNPEL